MNVSDLRREYSLAGLDERLLPPEPIAQFRAWLAEAIAADPLDPTAMTLATADSAGSSKSMRSAPKLLTPSTNMRTPDARQTCARDSRSLSLPVVVS